jgi:hypothetical protein
MANQFYDVGVHSGFKTELNLKFTVIMVKINAVDKKILKS